MKKYLLIFVTVIVCAQNTSKNLENIFIQNKLIGLTVCVFSDQQERVYNFGLRNLAQNLPVTHDTKFRVASISKAFTALGLLKLYDQKSFKLDEPISKYLGYEVVNPNFPSVKITFRMLLSHTSSIKDSENYDSFLNATFSSAKTPNISELLSGTGKFYSTALYLNKKPGTFFTYSNLNYGIIGTLIEKISQTRFDVFMKKEILIPLQISGSYNIQDLKDFENLGAIYRGNASKWEAKKDNFPDGKPLNSEVENYVIGTNGIYFGPQGGLRISALDLSKFLKFLKSTGKTVPNLISKTTLKLMTKSQWKYDEKNGDSFDDLFNNWGLGVQIANLKPKDFIGNTSLFGSFIGHAGDAYGLISNAYFSEKQDFGIVIVTNGILQGFQPGKTTGFYSFEEEIFKVLCTDFIDKKSKTKSNETK